jgi:Ulp1 family protease
MQFNLQYPNGDSNAITIKKHDYETLDSKQFFNDTILDFSLK